MHVIKRVAKHLFSTLKFLWEKASCVHTDLKPENLLVFDPNGVQEISARSDLLPLQFRENPNVDERSRR